MEWVLYENMNVREFYQNIERVLNTQAKAFKAQIQIGYGLIDPYFGEERYFWPGDETKLCDKPIAINSYNSIKSLIIQKIKAMDMRMKVKFPGSSWKMKETTAFKVLVYYWNHHLGQEDCTISDIIKNCRSIINFPNTENKCVLYCLAYHLIEGDKPEPKRMVKHVKNAVKKLCAYRNEKYSHKLFKDFNAIDIIKFDELEDCFKLNIDVFEMNVFTREITKIRPSQCKYENTLNILDYNSHAMHITEKDRFLNKYECNKCSSIFETFDKLHNHRRNKCQLETIESFDKFPKLYEPPRNQMKRLLDKFKIKNVDHYLPHFIVYDFESVQQHLDHDKDAKTKFTH